MSTRYMEQDTLEQEFIETFRMYGDAIFRFSLVKVSNKELAEDFTQEVFMRYWQSLREGKEMINTRAYLYTIAYNLAKDWYRKKKSLSLDERMENGSEPVGNEPDTLSLASYEEVLRAMEDIEPSDKMLLVLRFLEGYEPKGIAEITGESPNVISVRITRALARLRNKLRI